MGERHVHVWSGESCRWSPDPSQCSPTPSGIVQVKPYLPGLPSFLFPSFLSCLLTLSLSLVFRSPASEISTACPLFSLVCSRVVAGS